MQPTDWISAISTLVLVVITGYYAIITHRILKYQKDITELEYRPFLKQDKIVHKIVKDEKTDKVIQIQLGILFVNVGRVLLKYKVTKFNVSIEGRTNENVTFLNKGGFVYPGQSNEFVFSPIKVNEYKDIVEGHIEYEIEYNTDNGKTYISYRKYAVFFYNNYEYIEWRTIEEDEK